MPVDDASTETGTPASPASRSAAARRSAAGSAAKPYDGTCRKAAPSSQEAAPRSARRRPRGRGTWCARRRRRRARRSSRSARAAAPARPRHGRPARRTARPPAGSAPTQPMNRAGTAPAPRRANAATFAALPPLVRWITAGLSVPCLASPRLGLPLVPRPARRARPPRPQRGRRRRRAHRGRPGRGQPRCPHRPIRSPSREPRRVERRDDALAVRRQGLRPCRRAAGRRRTGRRRGRAARVSRLTCCSTGPRMQNRSTISSGTKAVCVLPACPCSVVVVALPPGDVVGQRGRHRVRRCRTGPRCRRRGCRPCRRTSGTGRACARGRRRRRPARRRRS